MAGGFLSLKWNNHKSTFSKVLSSLRLKEIYCDVTIACDGQFYPVHKLVLSTCSEYFEQVFEKTQCKHPVIILKDIKGSDLESLLNYMYDGEVNVLQENLAGLIKAAECLKIKGLAVPDEDPIEQTEEENDPAPASRRKKRRTSSATSSVSNEVNDIMPNIEVNHHSMTSEDKTSHEEPIENQGLETESNTTEIFNDDIDIKDEPSDIEEILVKENESHDKALASTSQSQQYVENVISEVDPIKVGYSTSHASGDSYSDWQEDSNYNEPSTSNVMGSSWSLSHNRSSLKHQLPFNFDKRLKNASTVHVSPEEIARAGRKCPVCHREFSSPSHMKRHLSTHTGEKPFSCTMCSYQSGDKGNLSKHIFRRHSLGSTLLPILTNK